MRVRKRAARASNKNSLAWKRPGTVPEYKEEAR